MLSKIFAVTRKDITAELRTRFALSAIGMFTLVTLAVVSMAVADIVLSPPIAAALLWITLLFSSLTGTAHGFVKEEDARTAPLLRVFADGATVYWGKFLFNLFLLVAVTALALPLFFIFTKSQAGNLGLLCASIAIGITGLAGATTIIAAVVAQAETRGALFATLSIPALLPLLLLTINLTTTAIAGGSWDTALPLFNALIAYDGVMITASTMLFDHVWR